MTRKKKKTIKKRNPIAKDLLCSGLYVGKKQRDRKKFYKKLKHKKSVDNE